jgi:hypothetical protein
VVVAGTGAGGSHHHVGHVLDVGFNEPISVWLAANDDEGSSLRSFGEVASRPGVGERGEGE